MTLNRMRLRRGFDLILDGIGIIVSSNKSRMARVEKLSCYQGLSFCKKNCNGDDYCPAYEGE